MSFIATVLYVPNTLDLFPLKCRALSFFKAFIHTRSVPSLGMYGRFSTCHPYNIQLFLSHHLFLCLNNTSSRRCFLVLRTKPVPLIILSWSILHFLYQYSQCICTYFAVCFPQKLVRDTRAGSMSVLFILVSFHFQHHDCHK